jgi:peptidoglycan-associated lipoprotein
MSKFYGRASAPLLLAAFLLSACQNAGDTASGRAETGRVETGRGETELGSGDQVASQTAAVTGVGASDLPGLQRELGRNVGDRVFFTTDHWDLSPDAQEILRRQAAWLHQHPLLSVTIAGYSDERGTREYNLALGERRATTVQQFMQALGVDAARLAVISYGKEQPDCGEANESCWSRNRRAVTSLAQQ